MKKLFYKILTKIGVKFLTHKIDIMKGSWKTTLAGIGVLLAAIGAALHAAFDNDPATVINIQEIIAALAGLGLLSARDNDKSSEDVGAK